LRIPEFLRTTAFRHSITIAVFFSLASILVFAFVYWQTVDYESGEIDHEVLQTSRAIGNVPTRFVERRLNRWLAEQTRIERYGLLLGADGAKLAGNMEQMPDGVVYDGNAYTLVTAGLDGDADDDHEIVRGVAIQTSDHMSLFVGEDTDEWEHFRNVVIRALVLGLVPTIALSCLGGALFGRSILGRMAAMDAAIDRIIHGDLSERLPRRNSGDEFDQLASRVNLMLDDLQHLFLEAQVVGDSIAHDLRTPLTRVRIRLENATSKAQTLDQLHAVITESVHWLDQTLGIITAVLRIGEIEHGRRRAAFRPFNAAALVREVYELMIPLAEEKGLTFDLQVQKEDVEIIGDRELILEALVNLVDNAIKFTPVGTACLLGLSNSECGASIRVQDSGAGIPEAERSSVLRRFYKGGASRHSDGNGLGLALVVAVARLHNFDFIIADNQPGCVMELRVHAVNRL
jgi:signal transduction histidine kinase